MRRALVIGALALTTPSCAHVLAQQMIEHGEASRMLPRFANCPDDHDPVFLLLDRHCPGGVCGYSCLPNRWEHSPKENE